MVLSYIAYTLSRNYEHISYRMMLFSIPHTHQRQEHYFCNAYFLLLFVCVQLIFLVVLCGSLGYMAADEADFTFVNFLRMSFVIVLNMHLFSCVARMNFLTPQASAIPSWNNILLRPEFLLVLVLVS